ncbi:unnamed protein product [Miscanthus lutarioriparius]|uniref:NB-ARC domain-containing protein n=1 Tax=Miscanthus lutarioriparius TaxID=422564 RepID=A0A811SBP1_9POAL|nr:unnamed protein product [Miscanthus lutarioriparius]
MTTGSWCDIRVGGADDDDKSNLVDVLYNGIINGWLEETKGVDDKSDHVDMLYKGTRNKKIKIERHSIWVDVPDPFNLKVFAQRLFLNFHSDNIRAKEITESTGDWDSIQSTFFSSKATTAKAGCILVITKEETVATHCVKGQTHLAFNAQDLKADPSISSLIKKGCWHYGIRGRKGRLFYDRRKYAREWANKFEDVGTINLDGEDEEKGFREFTLKLGGRDMPYNRGYHFDLTDFACRLLVDFYSDDPQAKEAVAVRLMEVTLDDPIKECREILRNEERLVVINGLDSKEDWDSIKGTFFSEQHPQSIILVGSRSGVMLSNKEMRLGTQEQCRLIDMVS